MNPSRHLSTGDILHCQGDRLISRLIRRFTKSRFSHTAICIRLDGRLYIADSQNDGTHLRPFDQWQKKYKYKFICHKLNTSVRELHLQYIRDKIISNIGTKGYDFKALLWDHPRYIVTGKWKGRKGGRAIEKFYCSEFVAYVSGFSNFHKLSPQDLYKLLRTNTDYKLYFPMGQIL